MNFIPRDLKIFLEDYKNLHTKILSAALGISDLNFHGSVENSFEIDFSKITITGKHSFLLIIKELSISTNVDSGLFTLSILTKDTDGQIIDYGSFYTGMIDNKKYRNLQTIGTSLVLNKPVKIIIKINFPQPVSSIFNIGVTVNH